MRTGFRVHLYAEMSGAANEESDRTQRTRHGQLGSSDRGDTRLDA
ncbi:hypothetical protein [Paenibacillus sp. JGP012]|nr:hypothetical protein [Paenibacillus sp. JGP012]